MAGYGAVLTAALAVAMALLFAGPTTETEAVGAELLTVGLASVPANSPNTVVITDGGGGDIATAADFAVYSIDGASTGTARFTLGAGAGQTLVCFNGAACDTDAAVDGGITVGTAGLGTAGAILFNVTLFDGVDGMDGVGGDGDTAVTGYNQTAALPSPVALTLYLGNALTGANMHNGAVPAVPATQADELILAARITTAVGSYVPGAGNVISFKAQFDSPGVFYDPSAAGVAAVMPTAWVVASGGAAAFDVGGGVQDGILVGVGTQIATGTTELVDGGALAESAATASAAVKFAGAGTSGSTQIQATWVGPGPTVFTSNIVNVFLFDPAVAIESISTTAGSTGRAANFAVAVPAGRASTTATVSVVDANGLNSPVAALLATSPTASLGIVVAATATPGVWTVTVTPTTGVGATPTGMHTINLALASAPTVVLDTYEIEVVSAPTGVEFVSLVDPDGADIPDPFFIDALDQNVLTVRAFTADDADALVGTFVAMPFTGSGIIFGVTLVGAGGNASAIVVGEDLGSTIIVLAGPGALLPVEILRATVGDPPAAAPAGGAAMLGGFIGAPGGLGSAFFDGSATPTEIYVTLAAAPVPCNATSLSVLTPGGFNSNRPPPTPEFVNTSTGMISDGAIGVAGNLVAVIHRCA